MEASEFDNAGYKNHGGSCYVFYHGKHYFIGIGASTIPFGDIFKIIFNAFTV